MGMGIQAYVAILLWVPVCFVIFGSTKPTRAAMFCYLLGLVLLPERTVFDLPLLPPLGKQEVASIGCYLGCMSFARDKVRRAKFLRGIEIMFVVVALANVGTALTNQDVLVYGGKGARNFQGQLIAEVRLSALGTHDIPSNTIRDFIGILLPFHIGRTMIRTREEAITFWTVFCLITLVMLLPMFFELRMSPLLHKTFWGKEAVPMMHNARGGGFKSTLFFLAGLALAMFLCTALVFAANLKRENARIGSFTAKQALGAIWFALLISKNAAANIYAVVLVPLSLARGTKMAARVGVVLSILVLAYPALRFTKKFPSDEITAFAMSISPERAQSLDFRFDNEDALLERANLRLWFGWGGFGRHSPRDEKTGRETTVADGEWIIRYSSRGLIGFIGSFGLLLFPVFVAAVRRRRIPDPKTRAMVDTMMLLVGVTAVDLLPNGYFNTLPYFLAGALDGLSEGLMEPKAPKRRGA